MRIDVEEKKMEIRRVELAADEISLTVLKRKEEIARLEKTREDQLKRAAELRVQLAAMEGESK